MRYVKKCSVEGGKEIAGPGWYRKLIVLGISASVCIAMYQPVNVQAGPPDVFSNGSMTGDHLVTQLDFLKWFVTLSGDTPLFDELSGVGDYVYWAKKMKMKPKGGWHPDAVLTQDFLAEVLQDVFKIKKGKGDLKDDTVGTLEREGIFLPDEDEISWDGLVSVVDDFGFQSRLSVFSHDTCSPITGKDHKVTNKKCTPPPAPIGTDPKRKFHKFKEKKASKKKSSKKKD